MTKDERKALVRSFLGRTVRVEIDRPIGYVHHKTNDSLHYPINYGYIPGVQGGDGEELDVYVLGMDTPVTSCEVKVVGIAYRADDVEDKLVAAPVALCPDQADIAAAIAFQEQYHQTTVEALYQTSCGVIPYRKQRDAVEFLLLFQSGSRTWSFPKGHREAGEDEQQTALRELREETGMQLELEQGFSACVEYPLTDPPGARKRTVLFLAQANGSVLLRPAEIEAARWVTVLQARILLSSAYTEVLDQLEAWFA